MANHHPHASATIPAWAVGLAGVAALAVAMGIGRFAFTPLLPLMVREGQLDVAAGGWLAAANYVGYLVGAMSAARLGWPAARLTQVALLGTAALTAAMALPLPPLGWAVLRGLAGVASAWAFVGTSVWCLAALAARNAAGWSSAFYAGVGAGIALAGLHCLAGSAAGWSAAALWWQLGGVAFVLACGVLGLLRRLPAPVAPAAAPPASRPGSDSVSRGLVACYAVLGFGYILPATFLPVMARSLVPDPSVFGLAWPVFGATAAASTLLAARVLRRASRLQVWSWSHALMGLGVLLPSVWLSGWTIALSALLVGGTFMVVTLAGVQEIRARHPATATAAVGRMTAAFALGQIAGPVLSSLLLQVWPTAGLQVAMQGAALALFATAAWLWRASTSLPMSQESVHAR